MEVQALIDTMKAGKENPPPLLEKIIVCLIPPAARESVAGDLWELYASPRQYARDALRVIPFIILSQARRGANLPVLALQGILLFSLLNIFSVSAIFAGLATAAILAAFVIAGVYQKRGRPSVRRAMVEAVLAAGGACELFGLLMAHIVKPSLSEAPYFVFLGPYMIPLLCLARTLVILWSDRNRSIRDTSPEELRTGYVIFERSAARRNNAEIVVLVGTALVLAFLPRHASLATAICAYLVTAIYLLVDGAARPLPAAASFRGLRTLFQDELARQHGIRCFVWWLWFVPLALQVYARVTLRGGAGAKPMWLLCLLAAALIFGFFIESLNRERRGRIHEEIGSLAALPEQTISS